MALPIKPLAQSQPPTLGAPRPNASPPGHQDTIVDSVPNNTSRVTFVPGTAHGNPRDGAQQPRKDLFLLANLTFKEKTIAYIKQSLSSILHGLQELKVHFQVCGYDPSENMLAITKLESIGSNLSQMTRYFNHLRLAKSSWTYWRVSWIPPTQSYTVDQFLLDCNAILSNHHGRFFEKRLQVPYSATVGWLFKSTDKLDKEALHECLKRELELLGSTSTTPFALYSKEPFKGAAQPDSSGADTKKKSAGSNWSAGSAIHILSRVARSVFTKRTNLSYPLPD